MSKADFCNDDDGDVADCKVVQGVGSEDGDLLDSLLPLSEKAAIQVDFPKPIIAIIAIIAMITAIATLV